MGVHLLARRATEQYTAHVIAAWSTTKREVIGWKTCPSEVVRGLGEGESSVPPAHALRERAAFIERGVTAPPNKSAVPCRRNTHAAVVDAQLFPINPEEEGYWNLRQMIILQHRT